MNQRLSEKQRARFAAAPIAHLATASADGIPHVVPLCFAVSGDVLYFAVDEKPKRTRELQRIRNLRENRNVAVLVDHYEDDWSRLWWVRADGIATEVRDAGEMQDAVQQLQQKYTQYRERPPAGPYIRVEVRRWSGWSASSQETETPGLIL